MRSWLLAATLHGCTCASTTIPKDPDRAGDAAGAAGVAGTAGAAGTAGTAIGNSGIDAGEGGEGELRVSIQATSIVLCPGQCAELLAIAANGHEPYRFSWTHGLAASAGPHEVCPDETTTYEVTASDTAIEGEFGRPSWSAASAIEIEVADAEACIVDIDDPPLDERELCSIAIGFKDSNPVELANFGAALSTDELGNLYVVGSHEGTIDLGGANLPPVGPRDGFVAKYDENCNLMWHQAVGCQGCDIRFFGSDVGSSELVVVGGTRAELDLDVVATNQFVDAAMLVQLDRETGELTRGAIYEVPGGFAVLYDVGVDARDDVTFIGYASGATTVAGVPLSTTDQLFVAKVTATGEHVFSHPIEVARHTGRIAVHPDGQIALTAWAEGGVQIGGTFVSGPGTGLRRFVVLLTPDGQVISGVEPDVDVPSDVNSYTSNAIAIDRDRNTIVEHHTFLDSASEAELPEWLTKLDADGTVVWTREVSPGELHWSAGAKGAIATDSLGNILHTDEIEVGTPVAGMRTENDVIVRKLDPNGTELWHHQLDSNRYEVVWGIAVSPDDSIWIAHGVYAGVDPESGTLHIKKLAP